MQNCYQTVEFVTLCLLYYWIQFTLSSVTYLFYTFLVDPIAQYFSPECCCAVFLGLAAPSIYLITALTYTRFPYSRRRRSYARRRCSRHLVRQPIRYPNTRPCLTPFHNTRRHHYRLTVPRSRGRFLPSSAITLPHEANDSIPIDDSLLQQLANGTSDALYFFDAYTSMIDIEFYDAISSLPEHYYSCFDYYNQPTALFFNKYQETCTDTYYDTPPTYVPFAHFVDNHLSSIDLLHQYRVLVSILKDLPTRYSAVPKGSFSYK
jgi:hypothetical protein